MPLRLCSWRSFYVAWTIATHFSTAYLAAVCRECCCTFRVGRSTISHRYTSCTDFRFEGDGFQDSHLDLPFAVRHGLCVEIAAHCEVICFNCASGGFRLGPVGGAQPPPKSCTASLQILRGSRGVFPVRRILAVINKKLSYRRETARQLPTWRGLSPPVHSPSPSG